jgi:dihydrofolate reductase
MDIAGMPSGLARWEIVVAVAENGAIGRDNGLPWRLPADLSRFKSLTLGKSVLMGRKTFVSIGRALPGRRNWVLSRSRPLVADGCTVLDSLDAARAATAAEPQVCVIGGAEIYRLCLPWVARIHLTLVHTVVERADAFFDAWREPEWRETFRERHEADGRHSAAYSFITLERAA